MVLEKSSTKPLDFCRNRNLSLIREKGIKQKLTRVG